MPGAGKLRETVRFFRPALDARGRPVTDPPEDRWALQFATRADIDYAPGGEVAKQDRLQGVQPVAITIRDRRQAREITTGWRVEHRRLQAVFNIIGQSPDPSDRAFIIVRAQADGPDPP